MKKSELRKIIKEELNFLQKGSHPKLKVGQEYQIKDLGIGKVYPWEYVGYDIYKNEYVFISRDSSPHFWEIATYMIPKDEIEEYLV